MTARAALTVVGQVAGAYVGAMVGMPQLGAAVGGYIGGQVGGAIDGPVRNSQALLEDLGAIKFDYGSTWPRIHGRYRFKVAPMWSSLKRPIAHEEEVDSKGGPAAVNTSYTYEMDWLCWAPLNAIGFARVWINGELKYSALADSDDETIAASQQTTAWAAITFFDGNAAQLPWPIYEAAVGTADASAYRYRPTLGIESLDLGPSGQPPLVEVEFFTNGTTDISLGTTVALVHADDVGTTNPIDVAVARTNTWGPIGAGGVSPSQSKWGMGSVYASIQPVTGYPHSEGISQGAGYSTFGDNFLDSTGQDMTVECWVYVVSTGPIDSSATSGPAAQRYAFLQLRSGSTVIHDFNACNANLSGVDALGMKNGNRAAAAHGTWHHMAYCQDANGWRSCLDGVVYEYAANVGYLSNFDTLIIGNAGDNGDHQVECYVDDVHVVKGLARYTGLTYTIPTAPFTPLGASELVTLLPVTLSSIVSDENLLTWSSEAGSLGASDINVTALVPITVTGFATTGSPRESTAQLMDVYYFGSVCSDKLYYRLRGSASVDTIAFDETGSGVGSAGDPFTGVERGNDLEVAVQVAVTGPNLLSDYEPGTENSDRLVGESVELRRYSTAVVFTPTERKGRADTMVHDGRVASHTAQVSLDDRHIELEPFDVWVQTDDEGNTYRVRAERETYSDSGREFDVVLDDASVLSSVGITVSTDSRTLTIALVPDSELILLDAPILRDVDAADPGIYAAILGEDPWPGGVIMSGDTSATLAGQATRTTSAIAGTTTTALGDWSGGNVFDTTNIVRVVVRGGDLSSSTIAAELGGGVNVFAFKKADGTIEIVQAVTTTLVAAETYDLSVLLRGRRGTEHAMTGHTSGETVVWLRPTGLARLTDETADIDIARYFKAVTTGQATASASLQTFTDTGVSLMPFAPVDLAIDVDDVVSWNRRSRLSSRFLSPLGDPPLGEANESYLAQLYNDSDVLQTSATVTTPEWDITGTGFVPGWYVKVAQVSGTIGSGYTSTLVL